MRSKDFKDHILVLLAALFFAVPSFGQKWSYGKQPTAGQPSRIAPHSQLRKGTKKNQFLVTIGQDSSLRYVDADSVATILGGTERDIYHLTTRYLTTDSLLLRYVFWDEASQSYLLNAASNTYVDNVINKPVNYEKVNDSTWVYYNTDFGNDTIITPVGGSSGWGLGGNTTGSKKKLGTVDNQDISIITNNIEKILIKSADTYSGVGTGLTGSPRLNLGTGTFTSDDAAINIHREITGSSLFSHAIRDESTFNSTTTGAYASFDAQPVINGTEHLNHVNGHQTRIVFNNSGGADAMYGHTSLFTHNGGTITTGYGYHAATLAGSGTFTNYYGFFMEPQTAPGTYFLYSGGTSPSYMGGVLQTGGNILCGGSVNATNLWSNSDFNSVGAGVGARTSATAGFYQTLLGHNAGTNMTSAANFFNTALGSAAGFTTTSGSSNTYVGSYAGYSGNGSGNVFLGKQAGFWETGSNKLIVDNVQRTDEPSQRTQALIYGEFDATATNQVLKVNGKFSSMIYSAASDPTTSDIPSGYSAVWKNTTSGNVYLWVNNSGSMIKVQLN